MPAASAHTAFRGLYDEHHTFVWAVLRKLGVPEPDAEDLLQEVFLVVHRRIDAFEGRSAWTTWLYGIATRVYWNYARRQRSRPHASTSTSSLPLVDPSGDPERFTAQRQASAMLEQLLGSLDTDKRTAYVLHAIEGLSAPQISALTGVKTRTIYSRLRAAKEEIERSAHRVQARARNDAAVRRLARVSTAHPPPGMRRRAWAALVTQIPALSGGAAATASLGVWPWVGGAVVAGAIAVVVSVVGMRGGAAAVPAAVPEAGDGLGSGTAPRAQPEPAAVSSAAVSPAAGPKTSVPPPRATGAPRRTPRSQPEPTALPAAAEGLLHRARLRLRAGQPADALALLRAHALAEPNSPLAHERDKTTLAALCSLGRHAEATALAKRAALSLPPGCELSP